MNGGAALSFLRAPPAVRRMALEATLLLALARALVLFVPMRHWRDRLDTSPHPVAPASRAPARGSDPAATARTVGRLVERVAGRLPFDASCLSQAMASQWMLRHRGIGSKLQLGARRRADRTVAFHAWLTAAGVRVVGGPRAKTYAVLSPSGDPGSRPGEP